MAWHPSTEAKPEKGFENVLVVSYWSLHNCLTRKAAERYKVFFEAHPARRNAGKPE
jgi:hypothetical protein